MPDKKQLVLIALLVVMGINVIALSIFFLGGGTQNKIEAPLPPGVLVWDNPFNLPETPHGGNILHAWNMSFNEIVAQLPYIAEAGFNTIQTSPVGAALIRQPGARGAFGRWYDLYQPTAFEIGNYLGTWWEFEALTRAAASYGIFIIVDAIPNHTTAYWMQIDPALRDHEPSLFHSRPGDSPDANPWIRPMDFGNRRSFVRSNLLGLWDFYTGRPEFQALYMQFLDDIITAGASGFRFDAAHHIELPNDPPDIRSDFWPNISAFVDARVRELGRIPFQYGEVLGGGYRANHYLHALFDHANYLVTPYAFSRHILSSLSGGFLVDGEFGWNSPHFHIMGNPHNHGDTVFGAAFTAADLGGHVGFAEGVVPWVESHDQYGNDGISRHLTDAQIIVGWALIAARQGTSPLFFVRPGDGFENSGMMFIPQEDGRFANAWGHQLLYRHPAVAAINWFANDFHPYGEHTSTHGNVALIQRGEAKAKTGAVLANIGTEAVDVLFPVEMVDGNYICPVTLHTYVVQDGWLMGAPIQGQSVLVLREAYSVNMEHSTGEVVHLPAFVGIYADPARVFPSQIHPGAAMGFYDDEGIDITLVAMGTYAQHVRVTGLARVMPPGSFLSSTRIMDEDVWRRRVPFTHGEVLRLGADFNVGERFLVTVWGHDADGNEIATASQSFIRREWHENRIRVEYVRDNNQWAQAGIWAWNDRGDVFPQGWPGPQMEWLPRLDSAGYAWVFYLPEGTATPVTLIFNNYGAGEQTAPYLTIMDSTRVFQIGDGVEIGGAEGIIR
ncbi:MAG: alpha-amylase family glycosyl hydrolase [Defluviitaleaceae bacterium]|nr:alpha-amylase family glycosyl hydrolase [Defluviitaleaceae bacterium]MCL2274916.1 alpha-amylase family glycosyl hydrolase [Defluviitaleaceae bacterium]